MCCVYVCYSHEILKQKLAKEFEDKMMQAKDQAHTDDQVWKYIFMYILIYVYICIYMYIVIYVYLHKYYYKFMINTYTYYIYIHM